jgi:hypothetical protein
MIEDRLGAALPAGLSRAPDRIDMTSPYPLAEALIFRHA